MTARALGRIGPPARAAAGALRDLLDNDDPALQITAAAALKAVNAKEVPDKKDQPRE